MLDNVKESFTIHTSTTKGQPMTSLKTLENSLFWQQHVLKQSRDPVQIERVKRAIASLEAQIKEQTK
jgi:hypothetical protein